MDRLGRYEIIALVGTGGMGRVYRAVLRGPAGFQKPVALKVLDGGSVGVTREARLGGLLQHPNLVEVYDVGEHDGTWYTAMELVEGGSLRRATKLPPRAVVEVGLQVCAGLAHAWRAIGLVHLDLKPANLLLDLDGTVKVADLGIAQARGFDQRRSIRGTRGYMSPEQARGDAVDQRADIFSLGVVLHELATGRRPIPGSEQTWSTSTGSMPASRPELDLIDAAWLAPVVERCIADAPDDRFGDMDELAAALRALDVRGPGLAESTGLNTPGSTTPVSQTVDLELALPSGNLAAEVDRFVGRDDEIDEVLDRLSQPGLTTLRGPGGIGKTRLAREAARRRQVQGEGGAWFCALQEARSRSDLLHGVARGLGIPASRGDLAVVADQLGNALAARGPATLVLDNLEQLVGDLDVLEQWCDQAPELRILATSRRNLGLARERVVQVGSLEPSDAAALLRTRADDHGVRLEPSAQLTALARALEGIPLALELCAARLKLMSPQQALSRLDQRLKLLQDRDGRTLRGTLAWSWELLSPVERAAAEQLAVFAGGFGVEAAEAVVDLPDDAPWILDVLESLLEQSILVADAEEARLGMYEAVRAFALEQSDREALATAEERHGRWFARLGEHDALEALHVHGGKRRRDLLELETANLAEACRRAIDREDGDVAVNTCAAAWEVYYLRGPLPAAAELAQRVLGMTSLEPRARAQAGRIAGESAANAGLAAEAVERFTAALADVEAVEDDLLTAWIRGNLGAAVWRLGHLDEAEAHYREAMAAHEAAGREAFVARLNGNLGALAWQRGDFDEAAALYGKAVVGARSCGDDRSAAISMQNLAVLHNARGRPDEAVRELERALPLLRRIGDLRSEGIALGNLGNSLRALDRTDRAEQAYDAALDAHRRVGNLLSEAILLGNRGDMRSRAGDHETGLAWLERALELSRRAGDPVWEGIHLGGLGRAMARQGRVVEARAHLERAIELVQGRHARAHQDFTEALADLD